MEQWFSTLLHVGIAEGSFKDSWSPSSNSDLIVLGYGVGIRAFKALVCCKA